jgi:glutamate-1-semialdehyde 2,1-aminomutase
MAERMKNNGAGGGKRSKQLFDRAQKVLVGGVNSPVRAFRSVGGSPLFISKAKGSKLTDADGRSYVDFCLSWGPMILGHAHPKVLQTAAAALKKGSSYGAPTELEIELAEQISKALPSMELVRFTSSGTEAVMSALRLARALTKRDKVIKFAGGYHGHVDSLLVAAGSGATTLGIPDSAGVPEAWAKDTLTLPYNDVEAALELFGRVGDQVAAVIVEPIAANMGVVPPKEGFLASLRKITRAHGSLLIFDEVITGFRAAYGGAQSLYGIDPDLTILGKIIGGGMPVGAYGGRREIMEKVAPLGPVYQAGTLSGNPVAMAAGLETLKLLEKDRPYGRLAEAASSLADLAREAAIKAVVPVQVNHASSMLTVFFSEHPVTDYASAKRADSAAYAAFFHGLLSEGVYFPPAQFEAAMLSTAHSKADLSAAARAFKAGFEAAERRALAQAA